MSTTTDFKLSKESQFESSQRIRNKLIFKLGVDAENGRASSQQQQQHMQQKNELRTTVSLLGKSKVTSEPLKGHGEEGEESAKETQSSSPWAFSSLFGQQPEVEQSQSESSEEAQVPSLSSSMSSREGASAREDAEELSSSLRKLSFNEEVQVCLIPKKEEYSKRIRGYLWNSPEELVQNAHRNTVEFAAEGWDWRNAMDETSMYRCLRTNELIHPIHIEQHRTQQQLQQEQLQDELPE